VYSRQIDGRNLTLAPSGWTYNNTFVLYDKETGSLWYPDKKGLMGIQGHYFNRFLPEIKSEDTNLGQWVEKHPQTRVAH
jgi:Protein of unknown function (DUF3179)